MKPPPAPEPAEVRSAPARPGPSRAESTPARPPSFLAGIAAIVWKDLAAEARSKELISAMLVFALLAVIVFNFALELDRAARQTVIAGVVWVTIIFSGTLGLNRSLGMEQDRGSLEGLLLAPVDRSVIYFGKMLGNLIFMVIVEAVIIPVFSLLFNVSLFHWGVALVAGLGTLGYSAVGTLLAAMAVRTRAREVMLPILLLPIVIPLLLSAVKATTGFLQQAPLDEITPYLNLLIGFDVLFTAAAFMVFDYVVEE